MRLDDDGRLYFVDRVKDMIKTGGENVYSVEVEQVLLAHPGVADVAVVGVPDRRWGEAVKAVVVPAPGTDVDAQELDGWCLARLGAYKRPRWYERADSNFPLATRQGAQAAASATRTTPGGRNASRSERDRTSPKDEAVRR